MFSTVAPQRCRREGRRELPNVQNATRAPSTTAAVNREHRLGNFRRLALVFLATALAVTMLAIQAPAPAQAGTRLSEAQRIVRIAKTHVGKRFRLGSTGMRFFDCSGLVYRVYAQAGLLNRIGSNRKRAAGYYKWFKQRGLASRSNPKVGDLAVWTKHGRIAHIGLYIGDNRALSALTPGVMTHRMTSINVRFLAFLHVRLDRR